MKKIVCVGEMLIDFVCVDTNIGLSDAVNFIKKSGGAPTNVAACIGKLGGASTLVAAIGNDPFGTYLKNEVVHYHVNIDFVETVNTSTTLAFVSLSDDGEREFAFNRGAMTALPTQFEVVSLQYVAKQQSINGMQAI
jgi:fructokinase